MKLTKLFKRLYSKFMTLYIRTVPYRQYIFELKLKNVDDIWECKTEYVLSDSYDTVIGDLYDKGYIKIDGKEYPITDVEYTKLIKTISYYLYNIDSFSDWPPKRYKTLKDLLEKQKTYFKYAKHFTSQELKEIINDSKNYYI